MKIFKYICIAMVLVLASCTKTEVVEVGPKVEIGFRALNFAQTKAGGASNQNSNELAHNTSLGVMANFTNGNYYFGHTQFKYIEGVKSWGAVDAEGKESPKYWPVNADLYFTVYAPYKALTNLTDLQHGVNLPNTAEQTPKEDGFELKDVSAEEDFLYGTKIFKFNKRSTACPITLKHAEAFLCFKVKCSAGNVQIKSVTIDKCNSEGDVAISYKAPTSSTEKEAQKPVWTPTRTGALTLSNKLNTDKNTPIDPVDGQVIAESETKQGLLVIPGNQTSFTIKYTPVGEGAGTDLDAKIQLGSDTKWEAGKKYIYTIIFEANEIKFTTSEEDWEGPIVDGYDPTKNILFNINTTGEKPVPNTDLGVQAYNGSDLYFSNVQILNSEHWVSDYNWPLDDQSSNGTTALIGKPLSFIAYSPFVASKTTETQTTQYADGTTPGTVVIHHIEDGKNLIWGTNTATDVNNGGKAVDLKMKSAKAKIIIKAKVTSPHTKTFLLNAITLGGLTKSGKLTLPEGTWTRGEEKTGAVSITGLNDEITVEPIQYFEKWVIPATYTNPAINVNYTVGPSTNKEMTGLVLSSGKVNWKAGKTYTYILTFNDNGDPTCASEQKP